MFLQEARKNRKHVHILCGHGTSVLPGNGVSWWVDVVMLESQIQTTYTWELI